MADHSKPKREALRSTRAKPDPFPAIGNPPSPRLRRTSRQSEIGNGKTSCDPRCERFAACRPDSPGWVQKKEVAAHLKTTLSALKQRALRLGYVSPARKAMPRSDQPKLCLDAAYFILCAQTKRWK
jgi:hypothetical protein